MKLNIAKEFSPVPIGRYRKDSKRSGEAFREDHLWPKIKQAIAKKDDLIIDFDGMYGLNSSFLEEAFGGLIREHSVSAKEAMRVLKFIPEEEFAPFIENIEEYIKNAGKE